MVSAAAASTDTKGIAPRAMTAADRPDRRRAELRVGADDLAGDRVLQQPVGDPRRLRVGVFRFEEAQQHDRQKTEPGQDAEIEVHRIERALHDLRVRRQDREALLALRAEQLQVEVDVGLGADALQKALDDLRLHQPSTCANVARAVSRSAMVTNSSAACACPTSPGPKTTASIPCSESDAASVQNPRSTARLQPLAEQRSERREVARGKRQARFHQRPFDHVRGDGGPHPLLGLGEEIMDVRPPARDAARTTTSPASARR